MIPVQTHLKFLLEPCWKETNITLVLCNPQHVAGKSQGEKERREENNIKKACNKDTWLYLFNVKGCPEKRNSQ